MHKISSNNSINSYRRQIRFIILMISMVVLTGLTLGIMSQLRFTAAETAWENHADRATEIGDAINELNRQIGYGGFIHNFKNIVLRRDYSRYAEKIESNIAGFRLALDHLDKLLKQPKDRADLAEVTRTFEEYASKYAVVPVMVKNGATSAALDAAVKVDDGPALEALSRLGVRAATRTRSTKQKAQESYESAIRFAWLGSGLFILTMVVTAIMLVRFLRQLITSNDAIRKTQQRLDILLDTAPDAMLSVSESGSIIRCNQMAEQLFGYSGDELIGMKIEQLIPERYRQAHHGHRHNYFVNPQHRVMGSGFALVALTRDGREPNVDISLSYSGEGADWLATITIRDTTEREHAKQELIKARDEAESASKAKSVFLSSISHELRTPMNAVLGYSQLLEYDETLSELNKDNVQEIIKAGSHLMDLVDQVLNLSEIEAGHVDLSLEQIEINPVISECLALLKPLADERGISIVQNGLADLTVKADRIRLKQVLFNLLSNAVKYNIEGGSVTIAIESSNDGRQIISVTDTGGGIPADHLGDLFQPFNRLGAESSNIKGTGIGLNITRKLLEMMDGTINVKSEVGIGSTFWIELPI